MQSMEQLDKAAQNSTITDATAVICSLYNRLNTLFNERLFKCEVYKNENMLIGAKGLSGNISIMSITRDVYTEKDSVPINAEIKKLLTEVESIVSGYEGITVVDRSVMYKAHRPEITCDYGNIRTRFNVTLLFEEIKK